LTQSNHTQKPHPGRIHNMAMAEVPGWSTI